MAKFDWGFDILNKPTAYQDGYVDIRCTRSGEDARFALGNNPDGEWGAIIDSNMRQARERDAECALSTWGWI